VPAGPFIGGDRVGPLISNGLSVHLTPALSDQPAAGLRTYIALRLPIRAVGGAVNDTGPPAWPACAENLIRPGGRAIWFRRPYEVVALVVPLAAA
jgi:hypothetical protein